MRLGTALAMVALLAGGCATAPLAGSQLAHPVLASSIGGGGTPSSSGGGVSHPASGGGGGAVSSVTASGSGITASPTTGAVVVANTGVTSAVAGSGVSVSAATGAVTFTALLTTGSSGGQTVIGDTGASGNLLLSSTSNATKGLVAVGSASTGTTFNETTGWVGIGTGTTNLTGMAAGSKGITMTSTGAVPVGLNLKQGTAAAGGAATALASLTVHNGANRVFEIDFTTVGTTTTGGQRWYLDAASTLSLIVDSTNGFQFAIPVITNTTFTAASTFSHTGSSAGFFNAAPAVQQTVGALTNSVTAGGTTGTVADFTSLTVYSTDAATIRNDIYQLARTANQITTALRNYGLGI
jgi:flagellar hook-associated protein 2